LLGKIRIAVALFTYIMLLFGWNIFAINASASINPAVAFAALSSHYKAISAGLVHAKHHPSDTLTFLTEPQAGITPWLNIISRASSKIVVNDYLLTDPTLITALVSAAKRGVVVDVMIDGNPYKDSAAPSESKSAFTGSKVVLREAPSRFEGSYSYDHAKYMVVDPGKSDQVAILGSPNATASAFDGYNAEDGILTTIPQVVSALYNIFEDDWQGHKVGPEPRRYLVVSPGSAPALTNLLDRPGPVEVMAEELGDAPTIYSAIEARGSKARVLLPSYLSYGELSYASQLERAGVQVRTLASPYIHAKLIIASGKTFIGSQNFSEPSLDNNREVGMITANSKVHSLALSWFNSLWGKALPLANKGTSTNTQTKSSNGTINAASPSTGSYPYIPDGDNKLQVESLWGHPSSTGATAYDGYPETVWYYPGGQVYFGSSNTVVYVHRKSS